MPVRSAFRQRSIIEVSLIGDICWSVITRVVGRTTKTRLSRRGRRRRAMSDRVARRALLMAITHRIFRQRSASHRRLVATCITSYALCQSPTGIRIFAPRISYP